MSNTLPRGHLVESVATGRGDHSAVNAQLRRNFLLLGALVLVCGGLFALGLRSGGAGAPLSLAQSLPRVRSALEAPDRVQQSEALGPLLLELRAEHFEAVAEVYEAAFDAGLGDGLALELLVERFARLDPLRVWDRIAGWPPERRPIAYAALLRSWVRSDPRAASEALGEIHDLDARSDGFTALIEGWAEGGSLDSIWRYLSTLGGIERERGTQVVLRARIARVGAEATLREVEALPEKFPSTGFQDKLLRTAVGLVARSQPDVATAAVEAHREEPLGQSLMRRVAVNWVTQDGDAAMEWVRTQPETKARRRVMREAYRRWLIRDRPAAMDWLSAQEQPRDLESILDLYATALARSDPRAALAWVEGIEDPSARQDARYDVAEVWLHEDPEAAGAWLRDTGLDKALGQRQRRRGARTRAVGLAESVED